MSKRILLTAFEPFGGDTVNPALEIARAIGGKRPGPELCIVPVTFRDSAKAVLEALERGPFDAVVMLGQAKGRAAITVERIAVNVDDASIPDNAGELPVDRPIDPEGPDGIFATLPVKSMVGAIRAAGIQADVSNSAGTYVCNHLMYCVLRRLAGSNVRAGFIHVPALPTQAEGGKYPSMPLGDMITGVEAALSAL